MNRFDLSRDSLNTGQGAAALVFVAMILSAPISAQEQQVIEGLQSEKTFTVKLKPPKQKQYCKANTAIEYYQSDDVAEVNVEIKNEDCMASSGSFTLRVRYRTMENEVVNLEFDETWQREDDQNIFFNRQYPIGKNVDLVRVRTARMKCVCAESEDENENQ